MLKLTLLPARQGDAIWIRWGDPLDPYQLLVDMGTEEIGYRVRERLLALPESARKFELLVVTHVDRDHIGGVLTCLAEADAIPGHSIGDVWFNGFPHLSGQTVRTTVESLGPAQGERLAVWLKRQPWNRAFAGGPVRRVPNEPPATVTLAGNLRLTVLGPTPARLQELEPVWKEEVTEALRKGTLDEVSPGLEALGPKVPPILEDAEDLRTLADTKTIPDDSEANGSSIALLLEYAERSLVLSGDAFAEDLIAGLQATKGANRVHLDAFKLPHHCSQRNITKALVEAVDCDCWLISTDGTQFRHPDPIAIARIILHSTSRPPNLVFNVPSKFNGWWSKEDWLDRYGYKTQYGTADDGLTVQWTTNCD